MGAHNDVNKNWMKHILREREFSHFHKEWRFAYLIDPIAVSPLAEENNKSSKKGIGDSSNGEEERK